MTQEETVKKIQEILDGIRPYIQMDGGNLDFIRYIDHYVYIKLSGACKDCAAIDDTLKVGILETLKSEIPEIEGVINVEL